MIKSLFRKQIPLAPMGIGRCSVNVVCVGTQQGSEFTGQTLYQDHQSELTFPPEMDFNLSKIFFGPVAQVLVNGESAVVFKSPA